MTTIVPEEVGEVPAPHAGRSRNRDRIAVWAIATPLLLMAVVFLLAPWLGLPDPNRQRLSDSLLEPVWITGDWGHVLGTDKLGRDLLSRLVEGGRIVLLLAVCGTLAGLIPGVLLGMVAGYRGGWLDAVVSRFVEAWMAIPGLLFAIVILIGTGRSLAVLVGVLGLLTWPLYARVVRADAIALKHRPFIAALRTAGVPTWRLMVSHMLPNVASTVLVIGALQTGGSVLIESGLSFLGIGVVSPQISWGAMLAEGRDELTKAWWVAVFPGVAISIVVLLTNLLGDALRRRFDPRSRRY
ncbi:ABC transporter permease subunit [Nakamurella sp. YIM 132087]|uniref:ABC transporter permease subunit n=1 Tax=Nakamurella alba TaxID=2665158 RepID=A0A7K1FE32_9ACTN|nr:ABC transporter permease [Nakamurella alba]MTD12367.1 ABC transporter permease subunit [Nakamurella alba]